MHSENKVEKKKQILTVYFLRKLSFMDSSQHILLIHM
jgi:hypothetical protein